MKRSQTIGKPLPTGIGALHSRKCASKAGGACDCKPSYRAFVYDRRSGTKIRKTFPTLAAAKAWREDARSMQRKGQLAAPSRRTFREVADEWFEGASAEPPRILTRSGTRFKPATLRGYRADLDNYLLPDLGEQRLADIRSVDLQDLVERLNGQGLGGSKVRNVVNAARVVFRHAKREVLINPASGLDLPQTSEPRDRVASTDEAQQLLSALPPDVRVVYATAFYGGLRRGELQALRWTAVDLAASEIVVSSGWDAVEGEIAPKSKKGTRTVPLTAILRDALAEHKQRTGRIDTDFVFGQSATSVFRPGNLAAKAAKAWDAENARRAEREETPLEPIILHQCRHTFVSHMVAMDFTLEQIGPFIGHNSTYVTERYAHLIPGQKEETRQRMNEYHALSDTTARIAQLDGEA